MPRSRLVPSMATPSSATRPLVGVKSPATHFKMVDLPQPEGPRNTTISPTPGLSCTSKVMSSIAGTGSPLRER